MTAIAGLVTYTVVGGVCNEGDAGGHKRYGKVRAYLFTFLDYPEVAPDNNSSERELRPTATYRKVAGDFRSDWGPDLFAGFRSVVGTAAHRGIGAYQAIKMILQGKSVLVPG